MKLIDKDAVLVEIENLLDKGKYHEEYDCAYRDGNNGALYALKGKVNTLEVKEVELSWEDIKVIEKLLGFDNIIESPKEFYQEVLKRFKTQKGE